MYLDEQLLTLRQNVDLTKPRDVSKVWRELMNVVASCPSSGENGWDASDVKLFADVINEEHDTEKDFADGLFLALRKCLFKHLMKNDVHSKDDKKGARAEVDTSKRSLETDFVHAVWGPSKKRSELDANMIAPQTSQEPDNADVEANSDMLLKRNQQKAEATHEQEEPIVTEDDLTYKDDSDKPGVGVMDKMKNLAGNFTRSIKRMLDARNEPAATKMPDPELEPIVFDVLGEGTCYPMYAIGIARQANGELGSSGDSSSSDSGYFATSRLNHCTCLLEKVKQGSKWTVKRCFSVVELNCSTDNDCIDATVEHNQVLLLPITSAGGAVTQALTYTMAWVIPSHASLGQQDDNPMEISWATIVGKKEADSSMAITEDDEVETDAGGTEAEEDEMERYRWVSGKIYVPERCGDMFEYAATGCGQLDVDEIISAYLETILFGLCAAKKLLEAIKDNLKIVPLPSSGRKLNFGGIDLPGMTLQGKTKVGPPLCTDPDDSSHWKISQGEIFTGKLNMNRLRNELVLAKDDRAAVVEVDTENEFATEDDIDAALGAALDALLATLAPPKKKHDFVIFTEGEDVDVDVVVKVSSLAVHKYLNHPRSAWSAIQTIQLNPSTNQVLFKVLYGAEHMSNTLITIMADLSMDYKVLTPAKDLMTLPVLWTAFHDLVMQVLVPLADIDIIHPDIRPGWNVTSNILYSQSKKPSMHIIDFDSLVFHHIWAPPHNSFQYISQDKAATAWTFLWWQCVTAAYAWYMKVNQTQMEKIYLDSILQDSTNEFSKRLGKNLCALSARRDIGKGLFLLCLRVMSSKFKVQL